MTIDAFKFEDEGITPETFARAFLSSPDFDTNTLKRICGTLNINQSGKRTDIVDTIIRYMSRSSLTADEAQRIIINHLVSRKKSWISFKLHSGYTLPTNCQNPQELVIGMGKQDWYGPMYHYRDPEAKWYLRPVFTEHWETPVGHLQPERFIVRWLCFARIGDRAISLHWRGFSHAEDEGQSHKNKTQFEYWQHVPKLFSEFEVLTKAHIMEVNLQDLILNVIWNQYRYNSDFNWTDHRIRAEAQGISLNARTAGVLDMKISDDTKGLGHLANTIRTAIEGELARDEITLSDKRKYDEIILGTIIRELGALSYEFSLTNNHATELFHAHSYFGLKRKYPSPDLFAHSRVFISQLDDLEQLHFLVSHVRATDVQKNRSQQISMF